MSRIFAFVIGLGLVGCSQTAQLESSLQTACHDALALTTIAGLVPGVGAIIPYITVGCATAEGLAKLAADPSSAEWLGSMVAQIKALALAANVQLP